MSETAKPWRSPIVFLATGAYLGFMPIFSGTFGGLWGLPLAWGLDQIEFVWLRGIVIVALAWLGIELCARAAQILGGKKDPGAISFDEIVSLPMTFFLIPMDGWQVVLAGFLLNRAFDIAKPWPLRRLEKLPEGLGIMADDWGAGVYSNALLRLLIVLNPAGMFP